MLCVLCAWAGAGAQQAHRMSWLEEMGASVSLLSCAAAQPRTACTTNYFVIAATCSQKR